MTVLTIGFLVAIVALLAFGYVTGTPAGVKLSASTGGGGTVTPTANGAKPIKVNPPGIFYQSDGSLTGVAITNDAATWPTGDKVWDICNAVATAEGYNQGAGAAPYDLNNPGDLSPGDEGGFATCGQPQFHGGSNIILFCTAEDGWSALYHKFQNIVQGNSAVYPVTLTWAEVATKYAGNSAAWLANVTNYLQVTTDSTPSDYVNATAA